MLSGCIAIASDTKNNVHTQLVQLLPHVICDLIQQTLFVLVGNTVVWHGAASQCGARKMLIVANGVARIPTLLKADLKIQTFAT
jgi:hypothetical protein